MKHFEKQFVKNMQKTERLDFDLRCALADVQEAAARKDVAEAKRHLKTATKIAQKLLDLAIEGRKLAKSLDPANPGTAAVRFGLGRLQLACETFLDAAEVAKAA